MTAFKKLSRHGKHAPGEKKGHRNGWGVGYFLPGKVRTVKAAGDVFSSVRFDETTHSTCSNPDIKILMGQLRGDQGPQCSDAQRCGPLTHRDGDGIEWLFVSDADIGNDRATGKPFVQDPKTETGPEKIFKSIMSRLKNGPSADEVVSAIGSTVRDLSHRYEYSSLHLALSDGKTVFLLRFAHDDEDYNRIHFCKTPMALVAASEPLQGIDGKWEHLPNHRILVFDPALHTRIVEI